MSCPDYYRLADGRELCDFVNQELSAWLKPRVSHEVYHCIVSAMEHRFRCGNKEGEAETDMAAEAWWIRLAAKLHLAEGKRCFFSDIMPVVLAMVDTERRRKDKHDD